jgi:hypothetical protein
MVEWADGRGSNSGQAAINDSDRSCPHRQAQPPSVSSRERLNSVKVPIGAVITGSLWGPWVHSTKSGWMSAAHGDEVVFDPPRNVYERI